MKRKAVAFGVGLAGCLTYLAWQWSAPAPISLPLDQLPGRFEPVVLGPVAPLGRYENLAFFTSDCQIDGLKAGDLLAGLPLRTRVSFYLRAVCPVRLDLQVRFRAVREQRVTFCINDQPWMEADLSSQWQALGQPLKAEQLRPGKNQLSFRMELGEPVEFRNFQVTTVAPDPSLPGSPLDWPGDRECRLPWNANLALAVHSQGAARLHWEALEADRTPGAAQPEQPRLRVSFRAPQVEWQREVGLTPGPQEIALPASPTGWGKLQLMALCQGSPLPGQLGLKLKQAKVQLRRSREKPTATPSSAPTLAAASGHPTVIFYLIDTLRADHLGCYGRDPSPSPEIDRFARDAVLFEDVSAQSGWTKPATASIMSSQWPWRHKVQDFADQVPATLPWLPQILKAGGYRTAAVVTNNLAGPDFGFARGYDSFQMLAKGTSEEAHRQALQWLEKRPAGQPFFLYVHTIDPHSPYMHSARYAGKTRAEAEPLDTEPRRLSDQAAINRLRGESDRDLQPRVNQLLVDYDHEISNNDHNFGLLMAWLKQHHLYDSSLIVVVSDHGEEFLEHGHVGHLSTLYQELLHVPLLIKFPGQLQGGQRVAQTWQQIDIAPSILRACGLAQPPEFQGRPFVPGAPPPAERPSLFSVQAGRAILPSQHQGENPIYTSARGIRQGQWVYQRVVACAAGRMEPEELYDLDNDPAQQHNLAPSDVGRSLDLSLLLEPLFEYHVQPLPKDEKTSRKLMELLRSLQYVR